MLFDNIRSLFTLILVTSIAFMFFNMNEEDHFQQDYLFCISCAAEVGFSSGVTCNNLK